MTPDERYALIARNTEEIVSEDELKALLKEKPHPHAYIGFACTGRMHIGYFVPIQKLVDLLKAGCAVTFLIADLHGYLDDTKTPWELLDARVAYYTAGVKGILAALDAPVDKVKFVRGSDFELDGKYMQSVLRMAGDVTLNRAKRAASEVVRFKDDPKLGGFVYPLLQIEDVYALKADIAFSGIDQRGIYMLGRDLAPRMDRDKYVCVFTPLIPGLTGQKMSASEPASKIDLLDDAKTVTRKVNKAHCPAKEKEGNGVLAFCEYALFPHFDGRPLRIERPEKFGGNVDFVSYAELEKAFLSGELHPADLKAAVARELNALLAVVQQHIPPDLVDKAY